MTNLKSQEISNVETALMQLLNIMTNPIWQEPALAALRATIINGTITTVTTVTTCATVTTVNQIAGFDAKQTMLYDLALQTWAMNIGNVV